MYRLGPGVRIGIKTLTGSAPDSLVRRTHIEDLCAIEISQKECILDALCPLPDSRLTDTQVLLNASFCGLLYVHDRRAHGMVISQWGHGQYEPALLGPQ